MTDQVADKDIYF